MAEYISRKAAVKAVRKRCSPCGEAIEAIRGVPSADAVVVTRCKDCANSYESAFGRVCAYSIYVDCTVPDDFYCASSKPKEGTC